MVLQLKQMNTKLRRNLVPIYNPVILLNDIQGNICFTAEITNANKPKIKNQCCAEQKTHNGMGTFVKASVSCTLSDSLTL